MTHVYNAQHAKFAGRMNRENFSIFQDKYPLLKAQFERIRQVPNIKKYIENRVESNPPGM